MQTMTFEYDAKTRAKGERATAIVGVVSSGNLEALFERNLPDTKCKVEIATSVGGFDDIWKAVVADFVERASPGGLHIAINDGGARPDTVSLRLMQGAAMMEKA